MEKNDDRGTAGKIEQDKASSWQAANSSQQGKAAKGDSNNDDNNTIIIVNDKNTLQSFIESSPLGVQFAIIVLFYLARVYRSSTDIRKAATRSDRSIDISGISFTSKDFYNTYSELASEMGLTKYLVRHMAFAEFMLTMEYLALVREEEHTANYRFAVDYDDLKWLASIALQHIAGGQSLSSPEIFYTSSPPSALISGAAQPDKTVNTPARVNSGKADDLIKDLSQSIFSREESMVSPGSGTSKRYDDFVRPRSKDYGVQRRYFPNRVPPTTYSFRRPGDDEWKRIINEFFAGQKCITCNAQILPRFFDVWIGEPLEDTATAASKRDQRMTEVLADLDDVAPSVDDVVVRFQPQDINSDQNLTDRELLTYSYGIIPMDGRDAFVAFAKQKMQCPTCGTNPANSVSLMPKY
jgi:hypothetical protein